ncbi:hypothetical protein [Helicobacter burdigaliensis]|uniref:hypothetical protein n=1 Tax=Helicobacter burdigaliensis TaxID=2315334 RepID=UPI0018E52E5A|nr:hypothetical protein [Helicobacter burdigaliensis]
MVRNVVLLGGSNSVMVNGLQKGLREGIEKYNQNKKNQEKLEFYNFAVGGCTVIQNLYELKRVRNQEVFKEARLIITESNINEIVNNNHKFEKLPLKMIYRNLNWFYQELYFLNTKVVSILLPNQVSNYKVINNIHRKLCKKYGFNCVDMQEYYNKHDIEEFGNRIDSSHQLSVIMQKFGENILENIDNFILPKKLELKNDNPKFIFCQANELENIEGRLEKIEVQNSMYKEVVYRIHKDVKLKFSNKFEDYNLIALHTWNTNNKWKKEWGEYNQILFRNYSSLEIYNQEVSIIKENNMFVNVVEIQNKFRVDKESYVALNGDKPCNEKFNAAMSWYSDSKKLEFCDLISFFLASPNGNYHDEEIDFEALANEKIEIETKYDFNHLIPPIELYKEIIDEYCVKMGFGEISYTPSICSNSAKAIICNHLSYKLGEAILYNLGWKMIRLIFIAHYIAKKHRIDKGRIKIINKPLETYPDYKEALRIQNGLVYKLGSALIKANNVRGGGAKILSFIRFLKEVRRLKREYKNKR